MTEIPADVRHSHVDVNENISVRESVVIDSLKNVFCNDIRCSKLYVDEIHTTNETNTAERSFDIREKSTINDIESDRFVVGLSNHCFGHGSVTLGGEYNEVHGRYSSILGGRENEVTGSFSTAVGGMDHQCVGNYSTCLGVKSIAQHDFALVLNTDNLNQATTTNDNQCIINAVNGTFLRLPVNDRVRTDHVPEGMACFVWDPITESVCIKTKQKNVFYSSRLPTQRNELEIDLNVVDDTISVTLNNPDEI